MRGRTELGCPGHLIVSSGCRWHRHTQVGSYRISTIGAYYLDGKVETIGIDRYYETMVFKTTGEPEDAEGHWAGCGCFKVADWGELDMEGYRTAGEARAGHERWVAKYSAEERDD